MFDVSLRDNSESFQIKLAFFSCLVHYTFYQNVEPNEVIKQIIHSTFFRNYKTY